MSDALALLALIGCIGLIEFGLAVRACLAARKRMTEAL